MAQNLWKVKQPVLNPFTATFLTGPVADASGKVYPDGAYVFSKEVDVRDEATGEVNKVMQATFEGKAEFEAGHETARKPLGPRKEKTPEQIQAAADRKAAKATAGASGVKPGRPASNKVK